MKTRGKVHLSYFLVNFFSGLLLIAFSLNLAQLLGVQIIESAFYNNIPGDVIIGLAIALLNETSNKNLKCSLRGEFSSLDSGLCSSRNK